MSKMDPEVKAQRAYDRALKANNVQRRFFVKMLVDEYSPMAKRKVRDERELRKEQVEQGLVLEVLDGSLDRLLEIRQSILNLKAEAVEIADEAKEHGLQVDMGSSYSRGGLKFYTQPDASDVSVDSCTKPGINQYLVGFSVRRCANNPWYAKLERLLERERGRSIDLDFDLTELRQTIWEAVSTPEITKAINAFKAKWITFDAGMED